jgi:hypothetical protein
MPSSPELVETYRAECERLGKTPGPSMSSEAPPMITLVHREVELGWKLVADACLHDMTTYADWIADGSGATGVHWHVDGIDELRATGRYPVLTPEECVAYVRKARALMLHPLAGGIDPAVARAGLDLIEAEVVPALRS